MMAVSDFYCNDVMNLDGGNISNQTLFTSTVMINFTYIIFFVT